MGDFSVYKYKLYFRTITFASKLVENGLSEVSVISFWPMRILNTREYMKLENCLENILLDGTLPSILPRLFNLVFLFSRISYNNLVLTLNATLREETNHVIWKFLS